MWFNGGPPGSLHPPGHPLHGMPHPAYPPGHPMHIPIQVLPMGPNHPALVQMHGMQQMPTGGPPLMQPNGGPPQRGRPPLRPAEAPLVTPLLDDKAKKQKKTSKAIAQKRPEEMNVGNGIPQITQAQLQNLGINPAQFALMQGIQLQNGVLQQQTSANQVSAAQQPVSSVQAPMIAHSSVPQQQHHLTQQQQAQHLQQAQAAQQAAAHQAAHQAAQQAAAVHAAQQAAAQQQAQAQQQQVTVSTSQQQPQQQQQQQAPQNPQAAQILQQFQAMQAAQQAQQAQQAAQQQIQLAQQIQQAQQMQLHAAANPPCPPPPPGIPSIPWPVSNPVCHVPYFDHAMYRQVNIEATPSHDASGMDLPLTDITTLRFFFNLGVQQSRNLITARQAAAHQAQQQAQAQQQSQQQQQQQQQNQPQQGHPSMNENLAASVGGNANILNLVNQANQAQVPSQNTLEQLNVLLGQNNILRQAQQLQGPQGQQVPLQQQLLNQQLNQILAAQRNQQQQQQQQLQQQANNQSALQQQINALLVQQAEHQRQQQQQNVQNAQIAAAATAAASASGTPSVAIGGTSTFQGIQQTATTPIPPAATPNSQLQQIQKHFDGGQTLLLQQALLTHSNNAANAGNKATLHDIRFQAMAQQQQQQQVAASGAGPSNLHPFIRPSDGARTSISMNGGEPTISPRPIPVDPSPPRATSGGSSTVSAPADSSKETPGKEDEKPSSSTSASSSSAAAPLHQGNPIGIANPLSVSAAGFHNSKPTTAVSGNGNQGSSGATPVHPIIQMSEDHFTETFRKSDARKPNGQNGGSPKIEVTGDSEERPPALAPILMMSYLNNCMSHAKTQLTANGVHVGVDDNGQLVDFSSRPIDPIFKDAREDMKAKDVRNLEHAVKRPYPTIPTQAKVVSSTKKSPSPQRHQHGKSPQTIVSAASPVRVAQNPLGINRSIPDAVLGGPPKIEPEEKIVEDDSEDDGAKRLRIATDEE